MADAETLRARGNALYHEGRFDEARALYADAITVLTASTVKTDDTRVRIAQLYSNCAQTYVQERSFALALQDAVRALEFDATNEKAQLRRLVALENLERFETAFRLVEQVLDDPTSRQQRPALFEYAITARRRLRKNMQQDAVVAKQESHAVGRMVHDHQKLRINFGCLIPSHVPVGTFFYVSVNIGNEFGLFRRDYLQPGERIQLQCVLRNNDDRAFKLVFQSPSIAVSAVQDTAEHATPVDWIVTLNDRGKATFQLAIESTSPSIVGRSNMAISLFVHASSAPKWPLLPIVSLPFTLRATTTTPSDDNETSQDPASSALGIHCCRPVWLPTLDRELLLAESPGNLGIGGKLWDSCLVLTRYLSRHKHELENKIVVELGSGLGLVGMFCALLGASHVTLTDMDDVVPLLTYNIQLNFDSPHTLVAVPHMWGTSVDTLPVPRPDVLVLSDVVYDSEGYAPLVASLDALASPTTTIFMAHRSRNPMEHQFFELLAATFAYDLVDWVSEEKPEASALGKDERALQDVKIFRISRRTKEN